MSKASLLLLLSFLSFGLFAQNNPITFKHLSLNEGLSQSPIFSMMQDKEGFIWIGSRNGLTRYDGYEFKVYQNDELNRSISQRDISSIVEDDDKDLWLTTSGGLYQFSRKTEAFTRIPVAKVKFTSLLYPAGANKFWLATDKGVKILDCKTHLIKDFISHQQTGLFVHTLFRDKSGILWSSSVTGIHCYNAADGRALPVPQNLAKQLNEPAKRIFAIQEDLDGDLWIGTEASGVYWYQRSTGQCINYLHVNTASNSLLSDFVKDLFVNSNGDVWVGTRNGLSVFNKGTHTFANYEHRTDVEGSLSNNTIWKIIKDKTGSIWVSTYAGGLNVYNPIHQNFSAINERVGNGLGLNKSVVNALIGDSDGGIWAGTSGGGLNYINTAKGISRYYSVQDFAGHKTSNIVKGLARDRNGNLWVATLDGLAQFEPSSGKIKYVDLGPGNNIFRANGLLCTDSGIWVGGDVGGLIYREFDGTLKQFINTPGKNSISNDHINCLLENTDKKGMWIGTPMGLCYLNYLTGKFTAYNNNSHAGDHRGNTIISMFRDSKQRLWLGTQFGLRLFNNNGRDDFFITKDDGLADNTVQAITQDVKGNLWISTNNGISEIKIKGTGKYDVTNYTALDGLSSNLWMANTVFKTASGTIFWGGVNGINSFDPDKIIRNDFIPSIVVTEFLIKNEPITISTKNSPLTQPIEATHSIVLKYDQNSFTFKFSALNFINPQKNSYAYKMDGLNYNHNWNFTGGQRIATYTELEPGTYSFKVKAANNNGVWNNMPYTINITILPPFWATWWAYAFYCLVVMVVFYFIFRFFRRQAKLERDLFHEHFQLERQKELHQMKLDFFTNISHELRTPLTLIAAPIEKLVKETYENMHLNKRLLSIQSNTNRLLKLINELMDFRKTETGNMKLDILQADINEFAKQTFDNFTELAHVKKISYSFAGIGHPTEIYFDPNQLDKVLFNLLSNAFKFTMPGGAICLKLTEDEQVVQIAIIDNGSGIPFEDQKELFTNFYQGGQHNPKHIGTGIGLAFSKSIVDLHKGDIAFKSNPAGAPGQQKTEFTVTLLKGTSHFGEIRYNTSANIENIQAIINDQENISEDDRYLKAEAVEDTSESKLSVLVVEDNDEVREFIIESLKGHYSVTGCENGRKGYEAAITEIPDLIITDVMMPEMDGMELCTKIKSDLRTDHIPVILLTARAATVHQISGLETGADAYISKPFSLQILQLNIRNLLASRQAMKKRYGQQITLQPRDVVITSNDGKYLNKLVDIIEEHMEDAEFGVAELSVEIGMSQPVLYRKVKALTDLSVADLIKSIRLKKAAMLLAQNKMTIADIAFAVGFNNRKHFSKEFRKQFNENPTTYIARITGILLEEVHEQDAE